MTMGSRPTEKSLDKLLEMTGNQAGRFSRQKFESRSSTTSSRNELFFASAASSNRICYFVINHVLYSTPVPQHLVGMRLQIPKSGHRWFAKIIVVKRKSTSVPPLIQSHDGQSSRNKQVMVEFEFIHDRQTFFGLRWEIAEPIARLVIVHGHGEHVGRYKDFVPSLNDHQISAVGIDLLGHGKTKSKRGHWSSYNAVLDSIEALVAETYHSEPDIPIFLYGHSMGGNLAANLVLRRQTELKGLILSSPWFRLSLEPPNWKLLLAAMARNMVPSLTQSTGVGPKSISRDPSQVELYRNDPLIHDRISAEMFVSLCEAGEFALTHADRLAMPTLIMHGDVDALTSFEASRTFQGTVSQVPATFKPFPGGHHELHHDLEPTRSQLLQTITDWIVEQVGSKR
jgi:acylglycerol lipase